MILVSIILLAIAIVGNSYAIYQLLLGHRRVMRILQMQSDRIQAARFVADAASRQAQP